MRFLTLTRLAMLLLAAALISIPLHAQEQQRPDQQPQTQQQQQRPEAAQPNMGQEQAQTFSGKITASSGDSGAKEFTLKDEATNASYKLDNADQAKLFAGKDVKVTGTLDPATNTIHVQKIELMPKPPATNQ